MRVFLVETDGIHEMLRIQRAHQMAKKLHQCGVENEDDSKRREHAKTIKAERSRDKRQSVGVTQVTEPVSQGLLRRQIAASRCSSIRLASAEAGRGDLAAVMAVVAVAEASEVAAHERLSGHDRALALLHWRRAVVVAVQLLDLARQVAAERVVDRAEEANANTTTNASAVVST